MYIDKDACVRRDIYGSEHICEFTGPCTVTGKLITVQIPRKSLLMLRRGANIQDALPDMHIDGHEFIVSGMSREGWQKTHLKQ